MDYSHLDHRHLDYIDIWTIPNWTTRSFGLSKFGLHPKWTTLSFRLHPFRLFSKLFALARFCRVGRGCLTFGEVAWISHARGASVKSQKEHGVGDWLTWQGNDRTWVRYKFDFIGKHNVRVLFVCLKFCHLNKDVHRKQNPEKIKLLETLKTANLGNLGIFHAFYIDGGFKAHSTEPKLKAV